MTHPPDEILSALLDGEPTADGDAAHAASCAACQDRLEALRVVATALAEPVPVAAHVRDAAVRAALVEAVGPRATLRRLAGHRATVAPGAPATQRRSTLSVAAAVLVALAAGGWLLAETGGSPEPTQTHQANALSDGAGSAVPRPAIAQDQAGATGGAASSAAAAGFYNAGDIGDYAGTDPVVARYRAYVAGSDAGGGTFMVEPPCPNTGERAVVWHAELTYRGVDAYARVLFKSQSDQVLEILNRADCALVARRAI